MVKTCVGDSTLSTVCRRDGLRGANGNHNLLHASERPRSGRPGSLLTLAPHRSGRAGSAASGSSTDSFATRLAYPLVQEARRWPPPSLRLVWPVRLSVVVTWRRDPTAVCWPSFPPTVPPAGAPFPPRGLVEALVRGCGQAYALQTGEPVTYRCGTRRVCQARSSGSERDTRARPHAVAPMNCVPEDSRRRSTCTGRTHSPRARADGHQTPSSTVAVRVLAPFTVDQAAVRCSCGHENVVSSVVPVSMSWTVTGMRTTATRMRRECPGAVKTSLQFSRVLTKPACIAGVLVFRPNRNALCGRMKL